MHIYWIIFIIKKLKIMIKDEDEKRRRYMKSEMNVMKQNKRI